MAISDGGQTLRCSRFPRLPRALFLPGHYTVLTPALSLRQPITKCKLAILVGYWNIRFWKDRLWKFGQFLIFLNLGNTRRKQNKRWILPEKKAIKFSCCNEDSLTQKKKIKSSAKKEASCDCKVVKLWWQSEIVSIEYSFDGEEGAEQLRGG